MSGSEGRTPAHPPLLFACIDGHALVRQTKHTLTYSSDRRHNCRIAHTQRNLDDVVLPVWIFKVWELQNSVSTKVLALSRGSALQRSGYFQPSHACNVQPHSDEPAREFASLSAGHVQHHHDCNNNFPCMITAPREHEHSQSLDSSPVSPSRHVLSFSRAFTPIFQGMTVQESCHRWPQENSKP